VAGDVAKRDLLICGEALLRKKAKPVRQIGPHVLALFDDMVETMIAEQGLGLAAPQIGESVQAIVVRTDPREEGAEPLTYRLLNPRLIEASGEQEGLEGCLSLPTLRGCVVRAARVVVTGLTPEGKDLTLEAEDLLARALQHEIDHLRGILFTDRAEEDSLVWMVPDEDEPEGFRYEPTTLREAQEAFDRLRARRGRGGG
jgi:peptide deformylase